MPPPCIYLSHPNSISLNGEVGSVTIQTEICVISASLDGQPATPPPSTFPLHPRQITGLPGRTHRSSPPFSSNPLTSQLVTSPLQIAYSRSGKPRVVVDLSFPPRKVHKQRDTFRHLPGRTLFPAPPRY